MMTGRLRRLALALAGGALSLGTVVSTAGSATAAPTATYYGTYEHRDTCVYLVTSGGTHYYLPGYTMGGNGALYKKGGGFIAYPGWRIKANGTAITHSGGTTICTTWV